MQQELPAFPISSEKELSECLKAPLETTDLMTVGVMVLRGTVPPVVRLLVGGVPAAMVTVKTARVGMLAIVLDTKAVVLLGVRVVSLVVIVRHIVAAGIMSVLIAPLIVVGVMKTGLVSVAIVVVVRRAAVMVGRRAIMTAGAKPHSGSTLSVAVWSAMRRTCARSVPVSVKSV